MRGLVAIAVLMMASLGWGQTVDMRAHPPEIICPIGTTCQQSPKVLKCGEYQHVEHIEGQCYGACQGNGAVCPAIIECDAPSDRCADDMHEVTEREWQALKNSIDLLTKLYDIQSARLKALESKKSNP